MTAVPSGIGVTKLLKLGDTRNLLCLVHTHCFCSSVLCSYLVNELPANALLLLDNASWSSCKTCWCQNASGHQSSLHPINTSLLQPMDQRVRATFKAHYLCKPLWKWWKIRTGHTKIIKDYWRSFDIMMGITNLGTAWKYQWTAWMECGANFPQKLCMTLYDLSQWRTLLKMAGWRKRWDWKSLQLKIYRAVG